MKEAFWNRIRQMIDRQIDARIAAPRLAILGSFDPSTHTGVAKVMPEGAFPDQSGDVPDTGWMGVLTMGGGGSGVYAPPVPGDQGVLVHQEHDHGSPIWMGRVNSASNMPPNSQGGEVWIIQTMGAVVKLTNDGHVTVQDSGGSWIHMTGDGKMSMQDASGTNLAFGNNGTLTLTGNFVATGDITDQSRTGPHATLAEFRAAYDAHEHPGVQNGSGVTETTTVPI
jgi:phage baseplate assembly protein gpV